MGRQLGDHLAHPGTRSDRHGEIVASVIDQVAQRCGRDLVHAIIAARGVAWRGGARRDEDGLRRTAGDAGPNLPRGLRRSWRLFEPRPVFEAGRHHLPRIAEACSVERVLHGPEGFQLLTTEDQGHGLELVQAHSMLAGDRAAGLDAHLEDLAPRRLDPLGLIRVGHVEDDVRVQVSVPRMEEVGQGEPVPSGHRLDAGEQIRKCRPGHDRVLDEDVGPQTAERAKRLFSGLPKPISFRFRRGRLNVPRSGQAHGGQRGRHLFLRVRRASFTFDDQGGAGLRRQSGGERRCLDHSDRRLIDDLQRHRQDPGRQDFGHRETRISDRVEQDERGALCLRQRLQTHRDRHDDAERPLRAHIQAAQVQASGLAAIEGDLPAVRQKDLQAEHVVSGHAVPQTVRSAGVRRDVPTDRAGGRGAGIG